MPYLQGLELWGKNWRARSKPWAYKLTESPWITRDLLLWGDCANNPRHLLYLISLLGAFLFVLSRTPAAEARIKSVCSGSQNWCASDLKAASPAQAKQLQKSHAEIKAPLEVQRYTWNCQNIYFKYFKNICDNLIYVNNIKAILFLEWIKTKQKKSWFHSWR